MTVQRIFIDKILSPINNLVKKCPPKLRDIMFILGGICLMLHCILHGARLIPYRFLIFFPISCVFLGIMILSSMGGELHPVRFRMSVFVPWMCCGGLMFISGVINNVDYLPDALLFLVAFPILYICFANADREKLFQKLISINKFTLLIFIITSFLFVQITNKKYTAFSVNVNTTSTILTVTSIFILVEIISEKKFSKKVLCDILLIGTATALNYYTNSRTGSLALIFAAAFILVLFFATNSMRTNLVALAKLGMIALSSVVLTVSLLYVFQLRQWLPIPYINLNDNSIYLDDRWDTMLHLGSANNNNNESTQPDNENDTPSSTDSESTQPDNENNNSGESEFFGNDGFQGVNEQKFDTNKSLDKFSTGRISVWKAYAKDLNFKGHSTTPTVYIDFLSKKDISSTHMTILQVAYESGVLSGISYFLFNIASGILSIIFAIKHRKEKYSLLPLAVTLVFGVISLLASNRVAFYNCNTLMYYILLFPIMIKSPMSDKL